MPKMRYFLIVKSPNTRASTPDPFISGGLGLCLQTPNP